MESSALKNLSKPRNESSLEQVSRQVQESHEQQPEAIWTLDSQIFGLEAIEFYRRDKQLYFVTVQSGQKTTFSFNDFTQLPLSHNDKMPTGFALKKSILRGNNKILGIYDSQNRLVVANPDPVEGILAQFCPRSYFFKAYRFQNNVYPSWLQAFA